MQLTRELTEPHSHYTLTRERLHAEEDRGDELERGADQGAPGRAVGCEGAEDEPLDEQREADEPGRWETQTKWLSLRPAGSPGVSRCRMRLSAPDHATGCCPELRPASATSGFALRHGAAPAHARCGAEAVDRVEGPGVVESETDELEEEQGVEADRH